MKTVLKLVALLVLAVALAVGADGRQRGTDVDGEHQLLAEAGRGAAVAGASPIDRT